MARTLERDWDAALAAEAKLRDDHHRTLQHEPERLSETDTIAVQRLAEDIPALWTAPSTMATDRQAAARIMIERLVIALRGTTEHADLTCHWAGGVVTRHALIRPVRRFEQLEQFDRLFARIAALRQQDADIGDRLNAEGWKLPPQPLHQASPGGRRSIQRPMSAVGPVQHRRRNTKSSAGTSKRRPRCTG